MFTESAEDVQASFESADTSITLWQAGKREQALSSLLETFENNPVCGPDWSWLAASWQLIVGLPAEQVLAVIRRFPSCVPEWYYANSLCLYAQLGDTQVSRSALLAALLEARGIGQKLLGKIPDEAGPVVELEGPESYPEHAGALWNETPGALAWLESGFTSLSSWKASATARSINKNSHYKLWLDNFEIGLAYLKRGDLKKARTSLLSALKEARRIGVPGQEFEDTLLVLIARRIEADEQIQRALLDFVEGIRQLGDTDRVQSMRAYKRAGDYYDLAELLPEADNCYRAAVDILPLLNDAEASAVSLIERAELLEASAAFWIKEEVVRSTSLHYQAIELRSSYLGEHPQLMDELLELHRCLVCQEGTEEEAAALGARMQKVMLEASEMIEDHHGELMN